MTTEVETAPEAVEKKKPASTTANPKTGKTKVAKKKAEKPPKKQGSMSVTELRKLSLRDILLPEKDNAAYSFVFGSDLGADEFVPKFHISTGVEPIDILLGNGGFASGKISEIYGSEKTGKSELAQNTCINFLRKWPDGVVIYCDQEDAIDDKKLTQSPEMRSDNFLAISCETVEDLFTYLIEVVTKLYKAQTDRPVLIVVDSLGLIETRLEFESAIGDQNYAPLARAMSSGLRKIKKLIAKTNAHLLFLNQTRTKIGSMFEPDTTPGGKALKFAADYRIQTSNMGKFNFMGSEKDSKKPQDGFLIQLRTIKNKRATPMREVVVPLIFHSGTWGKSGFNNCWAVFTTLNKAGKIKHVSKGSYCLTTDLEKRLFTKQEWPLVFKDAEFTKMVRKAMRAWGRALMDQNSLDGKTKIDGDGSDD